MRARLSAALRLISIFHRAAMNPLTLEPRRGVFLLVYYGVGAFAVLVVATMVLLCLEAYHLSFAREFMYRRLGEPVLTALESLLF